MIVITKVPEKYFAVSKQNEIGWSFNLLIYFKPSKKLLFHATDKID